MSDSEETIYSTMFSSLRHPARRKILRMLSEKPMSFSDMLEALGVSSSHLTYHLESLGELVSKTEDGVYRLSTFGAASVNTMRVVEEAPAVVPRKRWSLSLRWKSILAVFIIGVILLASVVYVEYGALNQLSSEQQTLQSKYSQLASWSASADNAISFLRDVLQVDVSSYHASLLSDTVEHRSDLGGVVEEILRYSLTSSESKIDLVFRFRNGMLSRYQIILLEGSPLYAQPQPYNVLDSAKSLLQRFQSYEDAAYLENMSAILASLNTAENVQMTQGSTKLNISISGDNEEIQWLYTENGVDFSPKSLDLIYESGVLKQLTDGWFLFTIGNTQVNVSSEEAIAIARNSVKGFTWTADGTKVSDFTVLEKPVSILFHPSQREEFLELIPYWYVTLYLDKAYPDGVNRIGVGVWADTGKVDRVKALSS